MNASTQTRRAVLATLLAGSVIGGTGGCSSSGMSLASLNPMSKSRAATANQTVTESIAADRTSASSQLASFGTKTKDAVVKTTGSVTGLFTRNKQDSGDASIPDDDPLRLDNRPKKVDPEVFVANGQLWESTGNFAKAMESYSKALEQQTNHAPALTNIARLHFRQGNHQQAASFFQKAIEQRPDDAELLHDLGLTQSRLGQRETAIESISRALELSPGNSRYANHLATIQFEAGNREAAFESLRDSNKLAVAHFNMAYLYFKHGQTDQAREQLNETLKFEPLAASDTAVKRAVDRSRQMLQQIEGGPSGLHRSGPEATIAAQPRAGSQSSPTSQLMQPQTPSAELLTGQVLGGPEPQLTPSPGSAAPGMHQQPVSPIPGTGSSYSLPSGFTMPTAP